MNRCVLSTCRGATSLGRLIALAAWAIRLVGALWLAQATTSRADLSLSIALSGTNVMLTWTNADALLQSSLSVSGGWQLVVDAASPYFVPATNPANFFRLLAAAAPNFEYRYVAPTFTTLIGTPASNCGCATPENPNATVMDGNAEDNGQGMVLLATGELIQRTVDLEIPGRGYNWRLERAYRSGMNYDGPLGQGWEFTQNRRLMVESNGNVLRMDGAGRADLYLANGGGFQSPGGFYTRLTRNLDGSFQERDRHGTVWVYSPTNDLGTAQLTTIQDRNSNTMSFWYNAASQLTNVTDTLGRAIRYQYDANGRLVRVVDFTGRTASYGYNTNGDLISVTSPVVTNTPNGNNFPAGKTAHYFYTNVFMQGRNWRRLVTITFPNESTNGPPRLNALYETNTSSPNVGRLVSLQLGGTNASGIGAGGTIYYAYTNLPPAGSNDFASPVAQNTVSNRNGNVTQYQFNQVGDAISTAQFTRGLRGGDPPSYTTTYVYNQDGALLALTNPAGNAVVYAYDSANLDRLQQGNLLQSQRLAGPPGGDQTTINTSYAYEPLFNFVTTATDGRGNTTSYSYDQSGNRTNLIYRIPSITESFQYNSYGQVTVHVLPDNGGGHQRRDVFNYYSSGPENGYLQNQVVDAGGLNFTTTYEYDAAGRLVRVVDARGNDSTNIVNALNQVVRQISRAVATASNGPVRYQWDFYYDANGNLVRRDVQNRDENGALVAGLPFYSTTYTYDILNQRLTTTQEVDTNHNIVTAYSYDANGHLTLVRFGEATAGRQTNNTVQYRYDERDLLLRAIRAPGATDQSTTEYDYDANGNLGRTIQGLEDLAAPRILMAIYDGFERPISVTDPMGNVSTRHYDANGNVVSNSLVGELVDLPGSSGNTNLAQTAYTYDAMDRRVLTDRAWFDTATHTNLGTGHAIGVRVYSPLSLVLTNLDANSNGIAYVYDSANRLSSVSDARSNSVSYAYDANGNLITLTEVDKSDLGNPDQTFLTHYTYDSLDRLVLRMDNLNQTNQFAYDSRHDRVLATDARGNATRYEYDGLRRLVRAVRDMNGDGPSAADPADIVSLFSYDDSSRRISVTDNNTNTTLYQYDDLGRRVVEGLPDLTTNILAYDAHDNRIQQVDPNHTIFIWQYDLLNRVTNRTVSVGAGVQGPTNALYQYDGLSRLVRAANDNSQVTRGYDSLSRPVRETQQVLPLGPVRTNSAQYDAVGNKVLLAYPGGRTIGIAYDVLNRAAVLADGGGLLASNSYVGPSGLTVLAESPRVLVQGPVPSCAPGPQDLRVRSSGMSAMALALVDVRLSSPKMRLEQRDSGNGTRLQLRYDGIQRIMSSQHTKIIGNVPIDGRAYGWDPANNKISMQNFTAVPPDVRSYAFDAANRLTQSQISGGPPPTVYNLDGVGNRVSVAGAVDPGSYFMNPTLPAPGDFEVNQYTTTPFDSRQYDNDGNLFSSGSGPRLYAFDSRNELRQITDTGLSATYLYDCLGRRIEKVVNGTATYFYYDGLQVIEEQNQSSNTVATYVYAPNSISPITMNRGGQNFFFHCDDQGSVVKATDSTGTIVEQYKYGDYGLPSFFDGHGNPIGNSLIGNPYLFQGFRLDAESGLEDGLDNRDWEPLPDVSDPSGLPCTENGCESFGPCYEPSACEPSDRCYEPSACEPSGSCHIPSVSELLRGWEADHPSDRFRASEFLEPRTGRTISRGPESETETGCSGGTIQPCTTFTDDNPVSVPQGFIHLENDPGPPPIITGNGVTLDNPIVYPGSSALFPTGNDPPFTGPCWQPPFKLARDLESQAPSSDLHVLSLELSLDQTLQPNLGLPPIYPPIYPPILPPLAPPTAPSTPEDEERMKLQRLVEERNRMFNMLKAIKEAQQETARQAIQNMR